MLGIGSIQDNTKQDISTQGERLLPPIVVVILHDASLLRYSLFFVHLKYVSSENEALSVLRASRARAKFVGKG